MKTKEWSVRTKREMDLYERGSRLTLGAGLNAEAAVFGSKSLVTSPDFYMVVRLARAVGTERDRAFSLGAQRALARKALSERWREMAYGQTKRPRHKARMT